METSEYTLTTGEVARQLGVGMTSVSRWADAGKLPYRRTAGKWRKFRQADVSAFVESLERSEQAS